jgi:hypothetical protein
LVLDRTRSLEILTSCRNCSSLFPHFLYHFSYLRHFSSLNTFLPLPFSICLPLHRSFQLHTSCHSNQLPFFLHLYIPQLFLGNSRFLPFILLTILIHFLFFLRFLLSLSFFFLVCDILTRTSLSTYTYLLFFFFIYNLFTLLFHFYLFSIPSSFFCHYILL